MKATHLFNRMLKVIENIIDDGDEQNVGICKGPKNSTIYILGDDATTTPLSVVVDENKTQFGVVFYKDGVPNNGYVIHNNNFLQYDEKLDTYTMAPVARVFREIEAICETFKNGK